MQFLYHLYPDSTNSVSPAIRCSRVFFLHTSSRGAMLQGQAYSDAGATAYDAVDGAITSVTLSGVSAISTMVVSIPMPLRCTGTVLCVAPNQLANQPSTPAPTPTPIKYCRYKGCSSCTNAIASSPELPPVHDSLITARLTPAPRPPNGPGVPATPPTSGCFTRQLSCLHRAHTSCDCTCDCSLLG